MSKAEDDPTEGARRARSLAPLDGGATAMPTLSSPSGSSLTAGIPGTQTLARGLLLLQLVATSDGVTVQDAAEALNVHRTVAYRLLATLAKFDLVLRADDSRYRAAAGLAALGNAFDNSVRHVCAPFLRKLADDVHSTVSLLVREGDEAVAILVIVPNAVHYHLSFQVGSRHPIDRGAAGIALLASRDPVPGERSEVTSARQQGWTMTFGEIEPNTYGLAVPIHRRPPGPSLAINLITHRLDIAERSREAVIAAAREITEALNN